MRVGVIDVGSNTIRLLVTERRGGELEPVEEEKSYVGLGAEILRHGSIGAPKLAEAVAVARAQAAAARAAGSELLEVVVAAPGRQAANADELVHELARATRAPVHSLSADDEAALAYAGAVAQSDVDAGTVVAVVDVGGGSTEIAVGAPPSPPAWLRSDRRRCAPAHGRPARGRPADRRGARRSRAGHARGLRRNPAAAPARGPRRRRERAGDREARRTPARRARARGSARAALRPARGEGGAAARDRRRARARPSRRGADPRRGRAPPRRPAPARAGRAPRGRRLVASRRGPRGLTLRAPNGAQRAHDRDRGAARPRLRVARRARADAALDRRPARVPPARSRARRRRALAPGRGPRRPPHGGRVADHGVRARSGSSPRSSTGRASTSTRATSSRTTATGRSSAPRRTRA